MDMPAQNPSPGTFPSTATPGRPLLEVVVGSTRPGRVGLPVAHWFVDLARAHGGFDVELVDLAEVDLPLFDEPEHPRFGRYAHPHTRAWSARVQRADAFVLVVQEYNHSFGAALKNALDYLHAEWAYKPVGFVSYGGVAAGTRAVQALKPVLAALRMLPVPDAVAIPFVDRWLTPEGTFEPEPALAASAKPMLDELARLVTQLAPLRAEAAAG
jgi:NAD(P)H-dependent FMN reductase